MFWIPGTFFPKIVGGLPIRSQEIKSYRKYIRRKKNLPKKILNLVKKGSSLIPIAHFCMVVNILCFHAFSNIIGLFSGDVFVWNHTGARKKVLENKVSNWQDFISGDFLIKGLFSTGLLLCEILGLFSGNFFSKNFFGGYRIV